MIKFKNQKSESQRPSPRGSRSGIAMIIALIFMMAFLTISTTISAQAINVVNSRAHAGKSEIAKYNAESAAGKARMLYQMTPEELKTELDTGETIASGEFKQHTNTGAEKDGSFRILGIAGSTENLSSKIGDWHAYPFPGSGTAGKNCDVYNQMLKEDDIKTAYGDLPGYLKHPEDYPCNWNKIRSFDSAVEIPLYATAPNGEKVWLKFDEIQIRVRTACNEAKFKETGQGGSAKKSEEEIFYEETGMCKKDKRYEMMFDGNINNPSDKDYLKNTVLNWGIYSDKGDYNWLIPIKTGQPSIIGDSNIHTKAINDAGGDFPPKGDFVVLSDNINLPPTTQAQAGFDQSTKYPILKALNKPSSDPLKPQISNPYFRFTVENKFLDKDSFLPMEPKYIPHLEYQILYKINEASLPIGMDINTAQISGIPAIIGEGYSGGFRHTVKMTIFETKTGFDYVYQKP